MKNLLLFLKSYYGQIVLTISTGIHTGKCSLFLKEMHFDLVSIIFLVFIILFYIIKVVWNSEHIENKELHKMYLNLEIILHVIFNFFFIYSAIKHHHYNNLLMELLIYWGLEAVLYIVKKEKLLK